MSAEASGAGIRVRYGAATDIGRVRETNEDSFVSAYPVFVVADGMGGHDAGEVASAIAVEEFARLEGRSGLVAGDLEEALAEAGRRIHALGEDSPHSAGTTVALVAATAGDKGGSWAVMNLGDSRVYRLSDEVFEQVSIDHSVVQELVDRGEITSAEARVHPYRNMITRALGAGPDSRPDHWLLPAREGDRLLLCSDGLSGEVEDPRIEQELRDGVDPQEICDRLVRLALDAGGRDNVTVMVLEATEVTDPAG